MALPTGRPYQEWKYYDFRANWSEFLRCWKSDAVQDVLYEYMQDWCENHTCTLPDGSKRTWKRGEPHWLMDNHSDYWCEKCIAATEEYIEDNRCLAKFERTMEQQGRFFEDRRSARDAFYHICWDDLMKYVEPRPDTLESMIMCTGSAFLYDALDTAARRMFPDENVARTARGLVLLPGRKLVFDFVRYYFDVVDGCGTILESDAEYDREVWEFLNDI